ncbi:MAG: methyltransferase [Pirellulales bacterium]|nr:methyltransferase [Pirellulales bacterium]
MKRSRESASPDRPLPPLPSEQLLIDLLPEVAATRLLCTSLGRGQLAQAAASHWPEAAVTCHFYDLHPFELARASLSAAGSRVNVVCLADFAEQNCDLVALPLSAKGESEFAREELQAAHQALQVGGKLIAATDNPRDTWLAEVIDALFVKVTRRATKKGTVYLASKDRPLKKVKNYSADVVFRDGERLLTAVTRPGVFAHRKIDPGCRQLLNAMHIMPGMRVLDLGCGSGIASLAAAAREENVQILAVDSAARAVQCVLAGAAKNSLTGISTELSAKLLLTDAGRFDLVLANPPYYANYEIARKFVLAARTALRPGGELLLVTKMPNWYEEHLGDWFKNLQIEPSKSYWIVRALR